MSTELATVGRTDFTTDQIDLLRRTICVGATPDELALFLGQCRRTGLDPFAKQIYLVKRQGKMVIQTGIDGYRLIADRTGQYAGNDDPTFDDEDSPGKATVTVWKLVNGVRCPFTASARWNQYFPGDQQGFMWKKMPNLMLGKCAEALALRKAFPAELSGLYIKEEMEQAGNGDHQPRQVESEQLQQLPQHQQPPARDVVKEWDERIAFTENLDDFNAFLGWPEMKQLQGEQRKAVWGLMQLHANRMGWMFDKEAKKFVTAPEG